MLPRRWLELTAMQKPVQGYRPTMYSIVNCYGSK